MPDADGSAAGRTRRIAPESPTDAAINRAIRDERSSIRHHTRTVDLVGSVILAIVVPMLINEWADDRLAIGWGVAFVLASLIGALPLQAAARPTQNMIWIGGLAVLWMAVPWLVWSAIDEALTAVTVLCLIVLAVHALNLSLAADSAWFLPSLAMGGSVAIAAFARGAWSHGLLIAVFSIFVITGGNNSDSVFRKQVRTAVMERFQRHRFEHEATHDALTGLPNRRAARSWLEAHAGQTVTVAAIDFDDFKNVNETWDHLVGDDVLTAAARGIEQALPGWFVSRFGGDEFFAFTTGEVLIESLGPFVAQSSFKGVPLTIDVGLSCGLAMGVAGTQDLHGEAEYALSEAKDTKGSINVMTEHTREQFILQRELSADFDDALTTGRIEAWAQPVVRSTDKAVLGYELLARWSHEEYGLLQPNRFLPVIGTLGRDDDLATYMIRQAAELLAYDEQQTLGWVSVNVEPGTFCKEHFVDSVMAELQRAQVDPSRLCVEITERGKLSDVDRFRANARRLRKLGVRLALDDFGSGHVSFKDVAHVSTNYKLDKYVAADPGAAGLARAVVAFAESSGALVIAEGVDTPEKERRMIDAGVPALQGYLYGRPCPVQELDVEAPNWTMVELP